MSSSEPTSIADAVNAKHNRIRRDLPHRAIPYQFTDAEMVRVRLREAPKLRIVEVR